MVNVPRLTITYFPFGGRGDPLRLAAVIGRIPFTHRAIEFKDWKEVKLTLPLGQVPILEVEETGKDKQVFVQSTSILRYIGKLGGLYPENPLEAMQVDSIIDTVAETTLPLEITARGAEKCLISDKPWTNEELLSIRRRIAESEKHPGLPFFLSYFENLLEKNGTGWLVGEKVTIADLALHRATTWISSGLLDGIPADFINGYTNLKSHHERVEAIPAVVDFRAQNPIPYSNFEFNP
jgi:prostaglandin-H2 D-isomerase / glutathione transferase